MIVIGLIGPIAAGKSVVLDEFRRHGAVTVEADSISRELLQADAPLLEEVVEEFGEQFVDAEGRLKRRELAEVVFADADARKRLEQIVHPAMVRWMSDFIRQHRIRAETEVIAVEAANLVAMGALPLVDLTVLVTAPRETRLQRLINRDGLRSEEAERRLRLHDELEIDDFQADYVIDTGCSEAFTRAIAKQVLSDIVQLADGSA